jgi:hypothetical protein
MNERNETKNMNFKMKMHSSTHGLLCPPPKKVMMRSAAVQYVVSSHFTNHGIGTIILTSTSNVSTKETTKPITE